MKGNINKLFLFFKSYCKGALERGTSPPAAHVERLRGPTVDCVTVWMRVRMLLNVHMHAYAVLPHH